MISAGIKEFKNKLSHYLTFVKKGEDVLITDRGKVVARVIKENSTETTLRQSLQTLIMKGLIIFPNRQLNNDIPDPMVVPGKPISEMVKEDRR